MIRYRYSAWDGSQDAFQPGPEDVLESLADYLLQGGDLQKALRLLMQRGMTDRHGQVHAGLAGYAAATAGSERAPATTVQSEQRPG